MRKPLATRARAMRTRPSMPATRSAKKRCVTQVVTYGLLIIGGFYSAAASGQCDTSWIRTQGGFGYWSDASNWSAGVPNHNNACIITNSTSVAIDINSNVDSLTVGSGYTLMAYKEGRAVTVALVARTITNRGLIEASQVGSIVLEDAIIDNTSGMLDGNLESGTISLTGTTVNGGSFGTLFVNCCQISTLNNVNGTGFLSVNNGGTATLEGSFPDILLSMMSSGLPTTVDVNSPTTLALYLSDSSSNEITLNDSLSVGRTDYVFGSGTISVGSETLGNGGEIVAASSAGNLLTITASDAGTVNNSGGLLAAGGALGATTGTLVLSGGTYMNTGGTIQANQGNVRLESVTIDGGTLSSLGTWAIQANCCLQNSTLNGVTNSGTFQVGDNGTALLEGSTNNTGSILVGQTTTGNANLGISGNVTLSGKGKVTLHDSPVPNEISGANLDDVLTNYNTIQGAGNISALGLVNKGTIVANKSRPLTINPNQGGFSNQGTLSVSEGSDLVIAKSFLNLSRTTLTGGSYRVAGIFLLRGSVETNGANIALMGPSSEIINVLTRRSALEHFTTNTANGSFTLAGKRNLTTPMLTNMGTLSVSTGSTLTLNGSGGYTQTGGKATIDGVISATGMASFAGESLDLIGGGPINIGGGSVFGNGGNLVGNVSSGGTITPADSTTTTGIMTVTGSYTQNSNGTLNINIAGLQNAQFNRLTVTALATLGGTLQIQLLNGFVPSVGDTFEILSCGSGCAGAFSTVNGTRINNSEHFVVNYNSGNVTLQVAAGG